MNQSELNFDPKPVIFYSVTAHGIRWLVYKVDSGLVVDDCRTLAAATTICARLNREANGTA